MRNLDCLQVFNCRGPVRAMDPASQLRCELYLTFDDGPDEHWTPAVLDALAGQGMKATFFMLGRHVQRLPQLAREVLRQGHEIGNHGFDHVSSRRLRTAQVRQDYLDGADAIADATGVIPRLFRPPYGHVHSVMLTLAATLDQVVVLWNVSAMDWGIWAQPLWIDWRLSRAQPGDIVLMHDAVHSSNRPQWLMEVLPSFLRRMKVQGIGADLLPAELRPNVSPSVTADSHTLPLLTPRSGLIE